jgi:hypothetical protein
MSHGTEAALMITLSVITLVGTLVYSPVITLAALVYC